MIDPLSEHDRVLVTAIDELSAEAGPVDQVSIDSELAYAVYSFTAAVVDGLVPEGVLFDANGERRQITFRLAFQRLIDELVDGFPVGVDVPVGRITYRVDVVRDKVTDLEAPALIRGSHLVIGSSGVLHQPGGRYQWAGPGDAYELVASRDALRQAKQATISRMAQRGARPAQDLQA